MARVIEAAFIYFAMVFGAGFVLGTLRTLLWQHRMGEATAVLLEIPLMMLVCWIAAGTVVRRWPTGLQGRYAIGALAFAMLMGAEVAVSMLIFGRSLGDHLALLATPTGGLGFIGQVAFAFFPAMRRP